MKRFVVFLLSVVLAAGCVLAEEKAPYELSVGTYVEYTDNRDSLADKVSNFDFYIQPRLDVYLLPEFGSLELYYAPSYRYRDKPSVIQNDSEMYHDFGLLSTYNLNGNTALRLNEYFNYTDDPAVQSGGATLRRDSSFVYNSIDVGINHKPVRTAAIDAMASYVMRRYDDEQRREESDSSKAQGDLLFLKQLTKSTALALSGSLIGVDYNKDDFYTRGYMSWVGAIGLENTIGKNIRGSVRVGYQNVDYDDADLGSETSPYVSLSLNASTIPTTTFLLSLTRMTKESYVYPFASQDSTDIYGEMSWNVPETVITIGLAGTYRMGDYTDEARPEGAASGTGGQDTIILEAKAVYNISDNLSVKLTQKYEDVDSDVDESFTRNSTALGIWAIF